MRGGSGSCAGCCWRSGWRPCACWPTANRTNRPCSPKRTFGHRAAVGRAGCTARRQSLRDGDLSAPAGEQPAHGLGLLVRTSVGSTSRRRGAGGVGHGRLAHAIRVAGRTNRKVNRSLGLRVNRTPSGPSGNSRRPTRSRLGSEPSDSWPSSMPSRNLSSIAPWPAPRRATHSASMSVAKFEIELDRVPCTASLVLTDIGHKSSEDEPDPQPETVPQAIEDGKDTQTLC